MRAAGLAPEVAVVGSLNLDLVIRVPGLGEVDWRRLVDAMYEGGFDGALSVEHEDPVWGGDPDRVKAGLEIAQRTLRPLIVR